MSLRLLDPLWVAADEDLPESLIDRFEKTHDKWQQLLANVDRDDTDTLKKIFHDQIFGKIDVSTYASN